MRRGVLRARGDSIHARKQNGHNTPARPHARAHMRPRPHMRTRTADEELRRWKEGRLKAMTWSTAKGRTVDAVRGRRNTGAAQISPLPAPAPSPPLPLPRHCRRPTPNALAELFALRFSYKVYARLKSKTKKTKMLPKPRGASRAATPARPRRKARSTRSQPARQATPRSLRVLTAEKASFLCAAILFLTDLSEELILRVPSRRLPRRNGQCSSRPRSILGALARCACRGVSC